MSATAVLKEEHGGVKVMLAILGKAADTLDAGGYPEAGHLEEIVDFLKGFVDACHHAKEEEHLFPALERAGVARDAASLEALLSDHARGRELVRGMAGAIPGIARGDGPATGRFVRNVREYRALLRAHVDREDNVLFPLCDARLAPQAQKDLVEAFERVEEERIGHGRHEAYHRLMDRLRDIYKV